MYLPYQIRQELIQCMGHCFFFKDNLESFFISCGVPREIAQKDRELPKFKWGRNVLDVLDKLEDGDLIQRRLVTEMCQFRDLPDSSASDRNAGLDSLRKLKSLAAEQKMLCEKARSEAETRRVMEEEKTTLIAQRKKILNDIKNQYSNAVINSNRQEAGFELEKILTSLFSLFEIEYRKSYKLNGQQVDGFFNFEGFDYLVEAKWTKELPNEAVISAFKRKVDTKLESTRGLFISINGFRAEVINSFQGIGNNIIFMDGQDLVFVLEGLIDLRDLLHMKIERAAQTGASYVSVMELI